MSARLPRPPLWKQHGAEICGDAPPPRFWGGPLRGPGADKRGEPEKGVTDLSQNDFKKQTTFDSGGARGKEFKEKKDALTVGPIAEKLDRGPVVRNQKDVPSEEDCHEGQQSGRGKEDEDGLFHVGATSEV
jgi:hypothetical protein